MGLFQNQHFYHFLNFNLYSNKKYCLLLQTIMVYYMNFSFLLIHFAPLIFFRCIFLKSYDAVHLIFYFNVLIVMINELDENTFINCIYYYISIRIYLVKHFKKLQLIYFFTFVSDQHFQVKQIYFKVSSFFLSLILLLSFFIIFCKYFNYYINKIKSYLNLQIFQIYQNLK